MHLKRLLIYKKSFHKVLLNVQVGIQENKYKEYVWHFVVVDPFARCSS